MNRMPCGQRLWMLHRVWKVLGALKMFLIHIEWGLSGIYGKTSEQTYNRWKKDNIRGILARSPSCVGRSNFMIFSDYPLVQTLL